MAKEKSTSTKDKNSPLYASFKGAAGSSVLAQHTLELGGGEECFVTHGIAHASSTDVTVREGFNRNDWKRQREEEGLPTRHKDIIKACQDLYKRIGLVRNVIDLMSDFAGDGIDIVHPVKSQEVFYQEWARRVNFSGRARDFMKNLLRDGNVIVRRRVGKLTLPALKDWTKAGVDKITKDARQNSREIPWGYTFISPSIVDKAGGEVSKLTGDQRLAINLPMGILQSIKSPKDAIEQEIVNRLPADLVNSAKNGGKILLDPKTTYVGYYKKDDWEDWAMPFLYSLMDDIAFKEKMKQADLAALDGVINVIRLWKLGKSEQQILPTKTAVNKLIGILQNNVGGGVMDIVWDDMIDMQPYYPPIDKILGSEKYKAVTADILRGLGMPDALIGAGDQAGSAQVSFVQLKTLVERLEYVREQALIWADQELRLLQKAMGFKTPPTVIFGNMSLRDENVEKQLIIQLLDRGIVSVEAVHKAFGQTYMVEIERIRREQQFRTGNKPLLERAGPYYRPESQLETQFKQQMLLQQDKNSGGGGGDNPSGDQPKKIDNAPKPGRPPNTKDMNPRTRTPKTLSVIAVLETIAEGYLTAIDSIVDPEFTKANNLKNLRAASYEQRRDLEDVKNMLLFHIKTGEEVTKASIQNAIKGKTEKRVSDQYESYKECLAEFSQAASRTPTMDERRKSVFAVWANANMI